ncbi:MAG: T9SS type A sorting domain-containing protein [Chitinophagales bacterium]|nr:T9SS type A sorting domain-containing protein [Chitinophagales bacterium]
MVIHDLNGCINDNSIDVVFIGLDDPKNDISLPIYPNTVFDKLTIEIHIKLNHSIEMKVLNAVGQLIYSKTETLLKEIILDTIDLSIAPSGIYLVEVKTSENLIRKKILVQKIETSEFSSDSISLIKILNYYLAAISSMPKLISLRMRSSGLPG